MRYGLMILLVGMLLGACDAKTPEATPEQKSVKTERLLKFSDNEIFVFTHEGCPYCVKALTYIKEHYNDLKMHVVELDNQHNLGLFLKCADKFKLDRQKLGTPLICMGNNYILGWTPEDEKLFASYAKDFQ